MFRWIFDLEHDTGISPAVTVATLIVAVLVVAFLLIRSLRVLR